MSQSDQYALVDWEDIIHFYPAVRLRAVIKIFGINSHILIMTRFLLVESVRVPIAQ